MTAPSITILYDESCPLCRMLGCFIARLGPKNISVAAMQSQPKFLYFSKDIIVLINEEELHGEAAWSFLVKELPALKQLSWLAARLGFESALVGGVKSSAHLLRGLCRRCGDKLPLTRARR